MMAKGKRGKKEKKGSGHPWWYFGVVTGLVLLMAGAVSLSAYDTFFGDRESVELRTDRILFVGDLFLGRRVETYMREYGEMYPFARIEKVFARHTDIIANFESAIPKTHRHTPDLTYSFSTDAQYLATLKSVGITGVSLANNHALDYGEEEYSHARKVFAESGVQASGHPNKTDIDDVQYYDLDTLKIALIPLNLTYGEHTLGNIEKVLRHAKETSDYQIVFVHWGTEYVLRAGEAERRIAYELIDEGVDAIIGHHPHVVQNIERYKDGIIFYSLGNFVFDQFNDPDLERGLTLSLYAEDAMLLYELIPVTSEDKRSSPRPMDATERETFLKSIAARSERAIQGDIEKGIIHHIYDIQ